MQQRHTQPCSVGPASGKAFLSPFVTSQLPGVTLPAVGGNHEAMNYLWELYYGGWVAPNIYYLGHAGVVKFGGIRIGGMSGIFNGGHYKQVSSACLGNQVQRICPFLGYSSSCSTRQSTAFILVHSGSCATSSRRQCPAAFTVRLRPLHIATRRSSRMTYNAQLGLTH